MKTRFRTVFILLAGLLSASQAQESPFKSFIAAIWPEYDRPGILVILTGEIEQNRLPLSLRVRLPDEAEVAMGVGQSETSTDLSPLPQVRESGHKWIDATLVKPEFQIEFYYNPFGESEKRAALFTLELNQPLEEYHVAIQEPLGGEDFVFSETELDSIQDEHGLAYFRKHLPELAAGVAKTFDFSYVNPTSRLTVDVLREMLEAMPPRTFDEDAQEATVQRYRLPTYQPYAILGIVALLIGIVFWRTEKKRNIPMDAAGKNLCPNCGERISADHNFCANCGRPVK